MPKNGILLIIDIDAKSARVSKDALEKLCANDIMTVETISKARDIINNYNVMFTIINFEYNIEESLKLLKEIRNDTNGNNFKMPIMAYIDKNDSATEKQAVNAGVTMSLKKPFSTQDLKDAIVSIINNPKNFVITDGYIGPDRRNNYTPTKDDKRQKR